MTNSDDNVLKERIVKQIRTVQDPELPINLYDLGLIYDLALEGGEVHITMTLTTPNCPVADSMPGQVAAAVRKVDGVSDVDVSLVFDPPWTSDMMSEDARMTLEMMGIDWSDPMRSAGPTSLTIGRQQSSDNRKR